MSAQTALKLPANHTAPISIATTAPKLTFQERRSYQKTIVMKYREI